MNHNVTDPRRADLTVDASGLVTDRRRDRRIPFNIQATFKVLRFGSGEHIQARIVNVSKAGLEIRTGRRLETGTHVEVKWPMVAAFGEVKYCLHVAAEEFAVGIEIEDFILGTSLHEGEHLSPSTLALSLAGVLTPYEVKTAGTHLETCTRCKDALAMVEDEILARRSTSLGC